MARNEMKKYIFRQLNAENRSDQRMVLNENMLY